MQHSHHNMLYRIPIDSVYKIAYGRDNIDEYTPWLRSAAYTVPYGKVDSFIRSATPTPGYYLSVEVTENRLLLRIMHKEAFYIQVNDLRRIKMLTVRNTSQENITDVLVNIGERKIPYNAAMKGFVLDNFEDGDIVTIQKDGDIQFYKCRVKKREEYWGGGYGGGRRDEPVAYKGYLVTNKPMYLPNDTVKYKAYLQYSNNNKPVKEDVSVSFNEFYYSKQNIISEVKKADEPGVYFGEFVLGDSIKPDKFYMLRVKSSNGNREMTARFKVEDYLLDETFLKVTGEPMEKYQPDDTVHLFAYGFTSNNLPVMDGTISITVLPEDFSDNVTDRIFVPDTLYHATTEVSPKGETDISFTTANFPPTDMQLRCLVRLTNSNFETKDTSFFISYTTAPNYLKISQTGNELTAELIHNKQSVPGKGKVEHYANKVCYKTEDIRFPYKQTINTYDEYVNFYEEGKTNATFFWIPAANLQTDNDFVKDTAYLQVFNPQKGSFYYSVYVGTDFAGYGLCTSDTLLKFHSRKGKTVTIIGSYVWGGRVTELRYDIYKFTRNLTIDLTKKDFVFPGQTDSITVSLSNADKQPVGNTNVTVLAFNNQFKEDNSPTIDNGVQPKPGIGAEPNVRREVEPLSTRYYSNSLNKFWLEKCAADTIFFYKNFYLLPDDVAWLSYDIPDTGTSQAAFYLKRGSDFILPEVVYVDNTPVYYRYANSTNPEALFIEEGVHRIDLRTADAVYTIPEFHSCGGRKINMFINVDSIGPFREKMKLHDAYVDLIRTNHLYNQILKIPMNDSLQSNELERIAAGMLLFRNELGNTPLFIQNSLVIEPTITANRYQNSYRYSYNYQRPGAVSLVGPFEMMDSIRFYQRANTKLSFQPELHSIFSFRPGMIRTESSPVYDYLKVELGKNVKWPDYGLVESNPPNYDSLQINPPSADSIAISYGEKLMMLKNFMLKEHEVYIPDSAAVASISLINKSDTSFKCVIINKINDTSRLQILRVFQQTPIRLAPGTYELFVVWSNDSVTHIPEFNAAANGITLVPVYYHVLSSVFNVTPPPFLKNYIEPAPKSVFNSIYINGAGELFGTVLDATRQPAINAVINIEQGGISKGGAVTDIDGSYSIKPLKPGRYTVKAQYAGHNPVTVTDVLISENNATKLNFNLETNGAVLKEVTIKYVRPLIDAARPGTSNTFTREQIKNLPTRSTVDMASLSTGIYQSKISIGGARSSGVLYMIDGMQVSGNSGMQRMDGQLQDNETDYKKKKFILHSQKSQDFVGNFLGNMIQASGIRKDFRDWAIWEPDLWTDKNGKASFNVTYPDNITSWRTYVIAMNRKGYAGKITRLTRSFKPQAAQLSVPRFLHYGDSVELIGKVMNYTQQPFDLKSNFSFDGVLKTTDTMTVHNTRVTSIPVAAPTGNKTDNTNLQLSYTIAASNGYNDGEERTIPVLPVGVTETKGDFIRLNGDTSVMSEPNANEGFFTGKTTVFVDGSLLDALLHEIETLKLDPHGCNEQMTTKLLAIHYEELVKKQLHHEGLNNENTKKAIIQKLVQAQNNDGSFGWWGNNSIDYRITNYVIGTMQKINEKGELDVIVRRGLNYLNTHLEDMRAEDKIASLSLLSAAGVAANYKTTLDRIDTAALDYFSRFTTVKIKKEQSLPYRPLLDSLMKRRTETVHGIYWNTTDYYRDWYRDNIATDVLAYEIIRDDSIYGKYATQITDYLLFSRKNGMYMNTATAGIVLNTLIPELLKDTKNIEKREQTQLLISGSLHDSVTTFPRAYELKDRNPHFSFDKKGISPVYVSVVYNYFDLTPKAHDAIFNLQTVFLKNGKDTVQSLKQGEKIILRTTVNCSRESEYVMLEIPIPAGCVPVKNNERVHSYYESAREAYKDHTEIFCGLLKKGSYTFDVELEVRYKGSFTVNPARASMMYYPDQYGNTVTRKIEVR